MFTGTQKRIISLWFPRIASDRILRKRPIDGAFALSINSNNTRRLYCLNRQAERQGLYRGMPYSDARAFCPELMSLPADPVADKRFLYTLRRWATTYCPWVGLDGSDGLLLNVTGCSHLFGGEQAMVADIRQRITRAGLAVRIGLANNRGAAWALAHYANNIAPAEQNILDIIGKLPVAALRIDEKTSIGLQRVGLPTIADIASLPRAPLARRFGAELLLRLDQALGKQEEAITPLAETPNYAVRMTLPEPIGLKDDLIEINKRLLEHLCRKLYKQGVGARILCLTLRRVDQGNQQIEIRLARAMRDPQRIAPLFAQGMDEVQAGFGIDQMRLQATITEDLPAQQTSYNRTEQPDRLNDLISKLGSRIGLENITRFLPADSHIPERSFTVTPAAYSQPCTDSWSPTLTRPLLIFPPNPIAITNPQPPKKFRWRGMSLSTARAIGPERITPEWWLEDKNWRSGLRDYWRIETHQGRRLWLFYTPQKAGWFVHGEFT